MVMPETINFLNRDVNLKTTSSQFSVNIGVFADYYFSPKFSLGLEAQYMLMGANMTQTTDFYHELGVSSSQTKFSYRSEYLQFPLIASYYINEKFLFQGGAYGSTLLSASKNYNWFNKNIDESLDDFSPTDFGLIIGTGFNLGVLKFTFRYIHGLKNNFTIPEYSLKNRAYQFMLQWKIYSDSRK